LSDSRVEELIGILSLVEAARDNRLVIETKTG